MIALKDFAIWYANLGWPVFPCAPGRKGPATTHGVKDATTDPARIEKWWATNPNYNIGFACGGKHGIYAIDVDVDDKVNGLETLKQFPAPPMTLCQHTPRGGLHFLYRTNNPPPNKNSAWPGIDIRGSGYYVLLAPSIHPNGKQYTWALGCAPWQIAPHEYPDFLRPAPKPTPPPLPMAPVEMPVTRGDRLRRASAYLAKVDAAVQGSCGHNKLLWAAQCMISGFLFSDEEAFNILALEFNPRCEPPWDMSNGRDHKDFCRKIHEARKNPPRHPRGWLLASSAEDDFQEASPRLKASIKSLIGTIKEKEFVSAPSIIKGVTYACSQPSAEEFEFVTNPFGFLGKFCSWVNSSSRRSQPILALGGTLAFFGALFGRKVKDVSGARTNVYCMGIGESSSGKQHVQDCVRKVVEEVGCHKLLGACGFASDTAIENTLARQSSVVFMLDEIGHILMNLKSKPTACTEKIIETLMRVWSSAQSSYTPKAYADDETEKRIVQPCLSIYGTSTQDRFVEGISTSELNDGWLSRCFVFHTDTFPLKNTKYFEPSPSAAICDFVSAWAERKIEPVDKGAVESWQRHRGDDCVKAPPTQIFVPTTNEANEILNNFDLLSREVGKETPLVRCLWAKAEENARKIALNIATSTNYDNPEIDLACADYGIKLSAYLLRSFGYNMAGQISSNPYEEKKNKLWSIIKKRGTIGCTRLQLARSAGWANKRERSDMLEDLHDSGRIFLKPIDGDIAYWVSEHYLE